MSVPGCRTSARASCPDGVGAGRCRPAVTGTPGPSSSCPAGPPRRRRPTSPPTRPRRAATSRTTAATPSTARRRRVGGPVPGRARPRRTRGPRRPGRPRAPPASSSGAGTLIDVCVSRLESGASHPGTSGTAPRRSPRPPGPAAPAAGLRSLAPPPASGVRLVHVQRRHPGQHRQQLPQPRRQLRGPQPRGRRLGQALHDQLPQLVGDAGQRHDGLGDVPAQHRAGVARRRTA